MPRCTNNQELGFCFASEPLTSRSTEVKTTLSYALPPGTWETQGGTAQGRKTKKTVRKQRQRTAESAEQGFKTYGSPEYTLMRRGHKNNLRLPGFIGMSLSLCCWPIGYCSLGCVFTEEADNARNVNGMWHPAVPHTHIGLVSAVLTRSCSANRHLFVFGWVRSFHPLWIWIALHHTHTLL